MGGWVVNSTCGRFGSSAIRDSLSRYAIALALCSLFPLQWHLPHRSSHPGDVLAWTPWGGSETDVLLWASECSGEPSHTCGTANRCDAVYDGRGWGASPTLRVKLGIWWSPSTGPRFFAKARPLAFRSSGGSGRLQHNRCRLDSETAAIKL